jgi:hypothetical protein
VGVLRLTSENGPGTSAEAGVAGPAFGTLVGLGRATVEIAGIEDEVGAEAATARVVVARATVTVGAEAAIETAGLGSADAGVVTIVVAAGWVAVGCPTGSSEEVGDDAILAESIVVVASIIWLGTFEVVGIDSTAPAQATAIARSRIRDAVAASFIQSIVPIGADWVINVSL